VSDIGSLKTCQTKKNEQCPLQLETGTKKRIDYHNIVNKEWR